MLTPTIAVVFFIGFGVAIVISTSVLVASPYEAKWYVMVDTTYSTTVLVFYVHLQ